MTIFDDLRVPFDASVVATRKQGGKELSYVSIDNYIKRLNDVVGGDWSTRLVTQEVRLIPYYKDGKQQPNDQYAVLIGLDLIINDDDGMSSRYGCGADVAPDYDKAVKTALAEALKKAANQFGIAAELWDEGHRQVIANIKAATAGDLNSLKSLLAEPVDFTGCTTGNDKRAAVLKHYGLTPDTDLNDPDIIKTILAEKGIL